MTRILLTLLGLLVASTSFGSCILREDTASQTMLIGPFLLGTDGTTAQTGLTIANTDIRLSKEGGNTAAKESGGGTHDEAGFYQITLSATDTNTAGNLTIYTDSTVDGVGIVPVWHECVVYATGHYDMLDGTTTIMTSRQTGNLLETTVATAPTTTTVTLTAAASNDSAYNYATVAFVGGTEECNKTVTGYTASSKTLTYDSACSFTVAQDDTVRIHVGASGKAIEDVETSIAALNDLSSSDVDSALTTWDTANDVWGVTCEDQGTGYTCREILSLLLSEAMGTCTYTTASRTWTCADPSGSETRFTVVYGAELDGDRTSSTPAPVTP